ncbi:MAG: hypothetical protein IJ418_14600 [Clostridia bacterium]|nr:hypothetical protein [Clostridia bacterium]
MVKEYRIYKSVGKVFLILGIVLYLVLTLPAILVLLYNSDLISWRGLKLFEPVLSLLNEDMWGNANLLWKAIINALIASGVVITTINFDAKRRLNALLIAFVCLITSVVVYNILQNCAQNVSDELNQGYFDYYDFNDADNITIKNIEIPWWYLLTLLTCIQLFWAREIRLDEGNTLLLPKDTISMLLCAGVCGSISLLMTITPLGIFVLIEVACVILYLITHKYGKVVLKAIGYIVLLLLLPFIVGWISVSTDEYTWVELLQLVDLACVHFFLFMQAFVLAWIFSRIKRGKQISGSADVAS